MQIPSIQQLVSLVRDMRASKYRPNKEIPLEIPSIDHRRSSSRSKVCCKLDKITIYFSSRDVQLKPSAEGFASAFLIPAIHAGRDLNIHPPVCEVWAQRTPAIPRLLQSWWAYQIINLKLEPMKFPHERREDIALAFSCGVDSFYSLFKHTPTPNALVCALGYDVKLSDKSRLRSLEKSVRDVAAELGIDAIAIETNLRKHRLLKDASWERTHGGALAAIAHLLSNIYGTFVISSSGASRFSQPWGSHWDLDPNFGSSAVSIKHFGSDTMRYEKLLSIANEPILRKHLRVCWKNRGERANCGLCDKCIRTMLTLDACGQLGKYAAFPIQNRIAEALENIPYTSRLSIIGYNGLLDIGITKEYQSPLRRLIERSIKYHESGPQDSTPR